MKSYLLLGSGLKKDLDNIYNSYLSNNKKLEVFGDMKSNIECGNIDLPAYSDIIINAHGSEKPLTVLCQETAETHRALSLIAKDKTQNFELFSCHSGAAINPGLTLSKSSTLITSTHDSKVSLCSVQTYIIIKLGKINTSNPFIKFVHYIYLVADEVKFAVQTSKGLLYYSSEFNTIKDYSNKEISKWRDAKLIDFINWVKSINSNIDDLQRSAEIDKFIEEFLDYKEVTTKLSKEYNIEIYKGYFLLNAAYINYIPTIDNLIAHKTNVNFRSNDGATAIHIASRNGYTEIVQKLIKAGSNLNIQDKIGCTPLIIATKYNSAETVQKLIDAGADVNIKTNDGAAALHIAVQMGYVEIVQKLIDVGADLDIRTKNGVAALHIVAQTGHTKIVQKLIDAGADSDIITNEGATAIFIAAQNGHTKIVQKLIDAGADVNIKINDGATPVYIAAQNGHAEILQVLIETKKADFNLKNNNGFTALYIAVQKDCAEIVQKLIDVGADLNMKFNNKITLLDVAIHKNHLNMIKVILSNGYNNLDKAIISVVSKEIHEEFVRFNINPTKYALEISISFNHLNVVKKILSRGYNDVTSSILVSASKEIQEEVAKFNENPVKYILESNNMAERAERALSTFLEIVEESTVSKLFYTIEPRLPEFAQKAFSYLKPESIIDHIFEAAECLAAQDYTVELNLYALCGEHRSWHEV